jgi:hypothetical protein
MEPQLPPRRSSRTRNPPKRFTEEFKEYDVFSIEHDAYIGDREHQELLICPECTGKCEKGQEFQQCPTCFRRWHLPQCWKGQCDECTSSSNSSQQSREDDEDDGEYDTQDEEEEKDSGDTSDSDYEGDEEEDDDDEDEAETDDEDGAEDDEDDDDESEANEGETDDDDEEEEEEEAESESEEEQPAQGGCTLREFMSKGSSPPCNGRGHSH